MAEAWGAARVGGLADWAEMVEGRVEEREVVKAA